MHYQTRWQNIRLLLAFTLQAIPQILREKKTIVYWQRPTPKTVTLSVTFYNHLFDDEVAELLESWEAK